MAQLFDVPLRIGRRSRGQHGAVAVEFALVLPILAMLLVGAVTAGVSFSRAIGVSNAVREGARFGAAAEAGSSWATDVVLRTNTLQFDDPATVTSICAQLRIVGDPDPVHESTGTCTSALEGPESPAGLDAGDCFVWVAASRPYMINAILTFHTGEIVRHSLVRYERPCP